MGSNKIIEMKNDFLDLSDPSNITVDNKRGENMSGNNIGIDLLFKELKDDMREREERSERRFQEQQELLLNRIDKKLDDRLGNMEDDIKDLKNSNVRWSIGIIASIIVAIIGAIPQLIQVLDTLMRH